MFEDIISWRLSQLYKQSQIAKRKSSTFRQVNVQFIGSYGILSSLWENKPVKYQNKITPSIKGTFIRQGNPIKYITSFEGQLKMEVIKENVSYFKLKDYSNISLTNI